MAPIEDLQARDLAWISDFVMQQVALMMHPVMDHLEQTDEVADSTQRIVERLGTDITELRGDLERTNKYLSILRQGLGMQSESRCVLERSVESTTRTVGRLDDTVDNLVGVVRRVEDTIGQINSEIRAVGAKHGELTKQATESVATIEDLHTKFESIAIDNQFLKDEMRNSDARLEVWQRDLRELRRKQLGITGPKFEEKIVRQQSPSSQGCRAAAQGDSWPQKKGFPSDKDCATPESGDGDQKYKRMGRVGSASRRGLLQPELKLGSLPSRSSSQAVPYDSIHPGPAGDESIFSSHPSTAVADETTPRSRLPILAQQPSGSRPPDGAYHSSLRLRFSETLARQPSRGSLN